ncbi:hypothetical protein P3688_22810 [Vibrio parahaemolyticus]|nr:hypothetical protein [Vibrio parahaemolyticus]MDF5331518.1 hypothetical protein [Vibrio parahaemolyticus]
MIKVVCGGFSIALFTP